MYTKIMAPLVAGAASDTGCYALTHNALIAWDGLDEAPTAKGELRSENRPKRKENSGRRRLKPPEYGINLIDALRHIL